MPLIYIALGSNLHAPMEQIDRAIHALEHEPSLQLLAVSPRYRSRPVGPQNQADFINAAASLSSDLTPFELLRVLQGIEASQGRQRELKWGPRSLDLDILLYGDEVIASPSLVIPHREMYRRAFVLQPLADLAPDLRLPDGSSVAERLQALPSEARADLTRIAGGE